ncbi:MAG: ferredoxin [Elusimicrobiota bacterium]|nr:ferredoxin [Elusimicrobiota bacterium]
MKAVIDKDVCTGCGLCVDTCPDVFEMQDTIAVVKVSEIPAAAEDCAKQSTSDCPVEAIKVE